MEMAKQSEGPLNFIRVVIVSTVAPPPFVAAKY